MMNTKLYEKATALLNESKKMTFDSDYESFEYEDMELAIWKATCAIADLKREHGCLDDDYENLLMELNVEHDRLVDCLAEFAVGDEMTVELMANFPELFNADDFEKML